MNLERAWLLAAALLLPACAQREDSHSYRTAQGADIVLSGAPREAAINSGQQAQFAILVSNSGPKDAAGVRILDTVGKQSKLLSITCTPHANAVCPGTLGASMLAEKLPSGGSLEFVVTAQLAEQATGTILNSMSASVDDDSDPNNNVVTSDVLVR